MSKLVVAKPPTEAERLDPEDDRPKVGSWWWIQGGLSEPSDHACPVVTIRPHR